MGFTAVKCPSCGANIELDESREFGFCSYCGAKIVQDKVIVEHHGTVKIDGTVTAGSLLERAKIMQQDGDFVNADRYFDRVLDIDPRCAEAYWGKMCCKLYIKDDASFQYYRISIQSEPYFKKAIAFSDGEEQERYQELGNLTAENQLKNQKRIQEEEFAACQRAYKKSCKRVIFCYIVSIVLSILFLIKNGSFVTQGTGGDVAGTIAVSVFMYQQFPGIASLILIRDFKTIGRYNRLKKDMNHS